jgi:Zn-dependent M28 family amino/carboxypeptidase
VRIRKLFQSVLRIVFATAAFLAIIVLAMCLAIRQPNFGRYAFAAGSRADSKILRKHVDFLSQDVFPRNPQHPVNLNRAADYIKSALATAGSRISEQTYTAGGVQCRNIIARFGPSSGPLIVVGAHYDVYGDFPGADDNASGVAGLLELARLLSGSKLTSPVELVAFSTEEPPYFGGKEMGSAVHARSLREAGVDVEAMISLEMIGYYAKKQPNNGILLQILYPLTGDFVVVVGRWMDRSLAREIKKSFRGASDLPTYSYSGPISIGADRSDNRNFWSEGYPAVMVTDTADLRNSHYHTLGDIAETLDYGRMAGVVDGVFNAVIQVSHRR